jgi:hypothetical protein
VSRKGLYNAKGRFEEEYSGNGRKGKKRKLWDGDEDIKE